MTTIFKTETRKIRDMRNSLTMHQKLSGQQVILTKSNTDKMQEVVDLLSKASNILETIK